MDRHAHDDGPSVLTPVVRDCPDGLGLDRLSLSFPVNDYDDRRFGQRSREVGYDGGTITERLSTTVNAGGAQMMLGVSYRAGVGFHGKIECNPSRMLDPEGCSLLPLQLVDQAVAAMAEVVNYVGIGSPAHPRDWKVKRADVARDFHGVVKPGVYVRGLSTIRRKGRISRSFVASDPALGNAETLSVGNGAGMIRLYDQHAAYAEKGACPGDMRFEVQGRQQGKGGWLSAVGIGTVEQLNAVSLRDLATSRWDWAAMGTEVTGAVNVVEAVDRLIHSGELSVPVAQRLLGQLVAESLGTAWGSSKTTRLQYDAFKRRLGVVPSAELFAAEVDVTVRGRLDWATGTEIAA